MFETDLIFDLDKSSHGHVHSSCIVGYPNGDILAVWYENGPRRDDHYYTKDADKSDDVRIGAARLPGGAKGWLEPFVMCDTFGVADNSPCLAIDGEHRLWLVYSTMVGAPVRTWESSILRYSVSSEYETRDIPRWDRQEVLIIHPRGPGRGGFQGCRRVASIR